MIAFTIRNLKLFFRDKTAVFFSLLAVFIVVGLYALFLGDVWLESLGKLKNARELMDNWIMAGLLGVTSVTTTMGAYGTMVSDRGKKIIKDFLSSPVKRSAIMAGYFMSSFFIGFIMTIIALVIAEIYIVSNGGAIISLPALVKVLGVMIISTLSNTAMLLLAVSFFQSENAFSTASTVLGTLVGFLTGIYIPIGSVPGAIQCIIKLFPPSHAVVLFRQIMMKTSMETSFENIPVTYLKDFKEEMGITFTIYGHTMTPFIHLMVLIVTTVIFMILSLVNISRKSR